MKSFVENRKYIENEFEEACFDSTTGLSADELLSALNKLQDESFGKPRERFCAEAYAFLLDNAQLEINERTPFSVKLNIGVDYSRHASIDVFDKAVFQRQRDKILSEKFPEEYARMCEGDRSGLSVVLTDYWHTVPDWENLIKLGFSGILQNAKTKRVEFYSQGDARAVEFLDSVIIRYEAIIRLLQRIYDYSLKFDTPEFSSALLNLISAPPKTLYEVMLFSVLFLYVFEIGCERGRSLGAIDKLYYSFYENELKNGKKQEQIKELFRYFFIHFTATKRFAQQPLLLCGSDALGNDKTNELSAFILDVYDELNILDPKIHIRYHKNIDKTVFTKVLSMIRNGHSSICIVNDDVVYRGYDKLGISREDSEKYVILGCYEPTIPGIEEPEVGASWINISKFMEYCLNDGRDFATNIRLGKPCKGNFAGFDDFVCEYLNQLDSGLDFAIDFLEKQSKYNILINPSPIYSSSLPTCIDKGRDVHEYPLKHNNFSIHCYGLATVVDSLVAIKKYVYEKREITLEELVRAVKSNWQGYEELRQKIISDKDKYGNGREYADSIMLKITNHLGEKYSNKLFANGRRLRLGLASIDFYLYKSRCASASADGRMAGEPISRNLCPSAGMDRAGITGYLQSVMKINSTDFTNSATLDFNLHPTAIDGEKGLSDFESLIKIFFNNGGFAIQGNVLNCETLREAQRNPKNYSNLQIRVCGWNEYFVRMAKPRQDSFIEQTSEK